MCDGVGSVMGIFMYESHQNTCTFVIHLHGNKFFGHQKVLGSHFVINRDKQDTILATSQIIQTSYNYHTHLYTKFI